MLYTQKLQIYKREGNMFSYLVFKKHYVTTCEIFWGRKMIFFHACLFLIKAHVFIRNKEEKRKMYKRNFVSNNI